MRSVPENRNRFAALAFFFGGTALVYVVSGAVTATSVGGWYRTLDKPAFNPPDWVFAPVWSVLFLMIAVAGWLAWRRADERRRRGVVMAYGFQLGLNCLWSILFFGLQRIGAALIEVVLLWAAILWTAYVFRPIDGRAALLFVPYALWVTFAIALNAAIWILN